MLKFQRINNINENVLGGRMSAETYVILVLSWLHPYLVTHWTHIIIFLSPEPTVMKEEATRRQNRSYNNKKKITLTTTRSL